MNIIRNSFIVLMIVSLSACASMVNRELSPREQSLKNLEDKARADNCTLLKNVNNQLGFSGAKERRLREGCINEATGRKFETPGSRGGIFGLPGNLRTIVLASKAGSAAIPVHLQGDEVATKAYQRLIFRGVPVEIANSISQLAVFKRAVQSERKWISFANSGN